MRDALTFGLTVGSPLLAVKFGVLPRQRSLDRLEHRRKCAFRSDRIALGSAGDPCQLHQGKIIETLDVYGAKIVIFMDERNKS